MPQKNSSTESPALEFQNKTAPGAQQYKAAERYLKRLEYQLSKLEELKDQHELHRKMRDGEFEVPCNQIPFPTNATQSFNLAAFYVYCL
jgi:hypothetical protein